MRFQAGIQILLVIIAIVIVVTAIKPKFAEITFDQNEIAEYESALSKANEYNAALRELINRENNIPQSDMVALNRYLPSSIDETLVSRDIYNIVVEKNGVWLLDIGVDTETSKLTSGVRVRQDSTNDEEGGFVNDPSLLREAETDILTQRFKVQGVGSYEQMKAVLADIERNAYPLRVVNFSFVVSPESVLHLFDFVVETYAFDEVNVNSN